MAWGLGVHIVYRVTLVVKCLGWVDIDMECSTSTIQLAWVVDSCCSGPSAMGTLQIQVNPTKVLDHQSHPVHTYVGLFLHLQILQTYEADTFSAHIY